MWTAFPSPDYYGSSAPLRQHRPASCVPTCHPREMAGRDHRSGSHVHLGSVPQAWCPAMPQRLRHGYAAGFLHGLPRGDINREQSFPRRNGDAHRIPAQIHQVGAGGSLLRGFQVLVPHIHRPVLLAGPALSGSAGKSRSCQGCFPPALPYRRLAVLSFIDLLQKAAGGVLSSPHAPMAPRGARCPSSTPDWGLTP